MYDDLDYAQMRLIHTYVRFKDSLVFVHDVKRRNGRISALINIEDDKGVVDEVWVSLKALDIKAFHLGYVNSDMGAAYFFRKPMREDWRQGARNQNTVSTTGWRFENIGRKYFNQAINNKYPNLKEAIQRAKQKGLLTAFHKKFSVNHNLELEYRGRFLIGNVKEDGTFKLVGKYNHLKEYLQEAING